MIKITEILITVQDIPNSELHELCVIAGDGFDVAYVTKGFDSVRECHEYAGILAKSLNLDDDSINAEVFDPPTLKLVQ